MTENLWDSKEKNQEGECCNVQNHIYCIIGNCIYNKNRRCQKDIISIGWKTSNELCCGEHVRYPICEDCKELELYGND